MNKDDRCCNARKYTRIVSIAQFDIHSDISKQNEIMVQMDAAPLTPEEFSCSGGVCRSAGEGWNLRVIRGNANPVADHLIIAFEYAHCRSGRKAEGSQNQPQQLNATIKPALLQGWP